jgi:CBS domain-containing protein
MRRQLIKLPQKTSIGNSINALIKYKINALLATDQKGEPSGVLSKTDVMGAYYAGLPTETPMEDIMSRPPLFCEMNDSLEAALERMRAKGIYRLYVRDPDDRHIAGALAYPDIVGLLYKYCHDCDYSHFRQKKSKTAETTKRFLVKEIMTNEIQAVFKDDPLSQVMEALSIYRFGALLILDRANRPCGVISKTDLALAYKHGVDAQTPAEAVMSSPVQSCDADEFLEVAIRKMVYTDVHRLFVHQSVPEKLVGVISLTDAARIRSGSCHACMSSRIKVDQP